MAPINLIALLNASNNAGHTPFYLAYMLDDSKTLRTILNGQLPKEDIKKLIEKRNMEGKYLISDLYNAENKDNLNMILKYVNLSTLDIDAIIHNKSIWDLIDEVAFGDENKDISENDNTTNIEYPGLIPYEQEMVYQSEELSESEELYGGYSSSSAKSSSSSQSEDHDEEKSSSYESQDLSSSAESLNNSDDIAELSEDSEAELSDDEYNPPSFRNSVSNNNDKGYSKGK